MSRIGNKAIKVPEKVKITVSGADIIVEGPLGKLTSIIPRGVTYRQEDGFAHVVAPSEIDRHNKGFQGMARAVLANMVTGVTIGFTRGLEISGVGYKADLKGNVLTVLVGYTEPRIFIVPKDLTCVVDKSQVKILFKGADRQMVNQSAATVRAFKPCDVYKAKGLKYPDEILRRKAGKAAGK
ncbi:MAG: 50S ribosomal protein L6 [Oxalobacteraceae bacterium]|nr:MAG: 50S ribosomal protein L6 [Oxalobacteraceae bacterium]